MMELRHIPFLHDMPSNDRQTDTAKSVMTVVEDKLKMTETVGRLMMLTNADSGYDHFTAFPVVRDDGTLEGLVQFAVLQGIMDLFTKDITLSNFENTVVPMEDIMEKTPFTVMADFPLSSLFPIFYKCRVEHVVVLDRRGKPSGVIHRTSLIDADVGKHTAHLKIMKKMNFKGTTDKLKRASARMKMEEKGLKVDTGGKGIGERAEETQATQMVEKSRNQSVYEAGELFEADVEAQNNVNKITKILTFGLFGNGSPKAKRRVTRGASLDVVKRFDRNSGGGSVGSNAGLELTEFGKDKGTML